MPSLPLITTTLHLTHTAPPANASCAHPDACLPPLLAGSSPHTSQVPAGTAPLTAQQRLVFTGEVGPHHRRSTPIGQRKPDPQPATSYAPTMACFGRGDREKTELREMLELSNAQQEEARKAAEAAARRGDELARQLTAKQAEINSLAVQLRDAGIREARLAASSETLSTQLASLQASLDRANGQHDELRERVDEMAAEKKQALSEVRRLTKDREYLKHRVDRMQKALSMLESVLDDTLREHEGGGGGRGGAGAGASAELMASRGAAAAAALRQSREAMAELFGRDLGGGDVLAAGGMQHRAAKEEWAPSPGKAKDQHHNGSMRSAAGFKS